MQFRSFKTGLVALAAACVAAPGVLVSRVEAQKQGTVLWYPVATVKRVKKPNRVRPTKVAATQKAPLLTLQWHLIQRGEGNVQNEADSAKEFQTGDQLKLAVTTNQDGFLYIVNQRPGKDSVLLFPDLRINNGLNRVLKDREYVIPTYCKGIEGLKDPKDCWIELGAPAGTEKMILIFSRDKITTLPNQIDQPYSEVKAAVVAQLIASSRQKVEQMTGELTIPGQKAVRYATRVQNTNPRDNEELIATIEVTHVE